jgi:eukaryotic-like serine/threonine-protein kinase
MARTEVSHSKAIHFTSVLSRTQGVLRRHVWLWPLLAAVILVFVGVWVRGRMEGAMRAQLAGNLQTILAANAEALRRWQETVKSQAEIAAEDEHLHELVTKLLERAHTQGDSPAALLGSRELAGIRAHLKPVMERFGFVAFAVLDTNNVVLAAVRDQLIGMRSPPGYAEGFRSSLEGTSAVTHPFPSVAMLTNKLGELRTGVPTMFATAPVRGADGKVVAALGFRMDPNENFTRILATARVGKSGETYAFDRKGVLLSDSRFDEQLKHLSLIPDSAEAQSILTLELRDPHVDLTRGKVAPSRRAELPFTRAVAEAIAGRDGIDVKGYRDYRGVPVVGAWTWLPNSDMGLVTELDVAEAFGPLHALRMGFYFIFGLLVLGAIAIFVLMRMANRFQKSAQAAAMQAKQLGQYALDEKIGAGAFGTVYRGHHALMRRPVAVKLLDPAVANDTIIARFEREVQLTCQLTHPNTIALYDYGRTPEGLFYYAMEYLDGMSLDQLVKRYGRLPEERAIYFLIQIAASLAEAHGQGLIHRDIKPHNIFVTRRGDIADFVKVLDFGLVKGSNHNGEAELTTDDGILGTPLYMSPEAIERPSSIDARSDIYSLGAVAYYLVTGQPPFSGLTIAEILTHQMRTEATRPSDCLTKPLSEDFEELVLRCLAKDPDGRPHSARALEVALRRCVRAGNWGPEEAEAWWRHLAAMEVVKTVVVPKGEALAPV